MPTLADIYSAIDTMKRRGSDFVQNPVTSLQQMLGNANDRARNLNELTARAAQETARTGQIYGNPAQEQLTNALADSYNPVGMTVWHGSPHVFERFDLGKIGTGEGSQMHGKGLYVTDSPEIARQYASIAYKPGLRQGTALESNDATLDAIIKLNASSFTNGDVSKLADIIKRKPGAFDKPEEMLERIKSYTNNNPTGYIYKIDLPDTHVRRMLDWDAPLKDQPNHVRRLAKSLNMDLNDLGSELVAKVGKTEEGKKAMQDAGISGVKYIDPTTQNNQVSKRNFVVFDANHLNILERIKQAAND